MRPSPYVHDVEELLELLGLLWLLEELLEDREELEELLELLGLLWLLLELLEELLDQLLEPSACPTCSGSDARVAACK